MTAAALTLRAVRKRYGKIAALDGLDLTVPTGSLTGLVGPNGAGKTTTFGIVGGMIRPDAGFVDVLGAGPFDAARHAGRITLLPQDCELNPHTPVQDLLAFYGRLQGLGAADARRDASRVLDLVSLSDRAGSRVRQLSHGMKRRVAVAQAFVGSPQIVLLDEPTSGLDPDLVVRMRELLASHRGRTTLVVSSHVLADLEAICDHVVFMEAGRSVRSGPTAEVTGRRDFVRVLLEGGVPGLLDALASALPDVRASLDDGSCLTLWAPDGVDIAALNARVLPVLLAAGARVIEVHRGQSLEAAYMDGRAPRRSSSAV